MEGKFASDRELGEEMRRVVNEESKKDEERYKTELEKRLNSAENYGEKVLEIPVNLSFTVKLPENTLKSAVRDRTELDNMIFYQTHDVIQQIKEQIANGVKEKL